MCLFSIIKKVGDTFKIFPSPFWGRVKPGGENRKGTYPIKGIYFLNHSDENFIRPFKQKQKKFISLHQNVVMFHALRDHCSKIFRLESELIEKVQLFKLYFVPNHSVWGCIEND